MHPRILYGVACLGIIALVAWGLVPPDSIAIAEATEHLERHVRIEGVVHGADPDKNRYTLQDGSWALRVYGPPPPEGSWVAAAGRLSQWRGVLSLHASETTLLEAPPVATPTWKQLTADPGSYTHRPLELSGELRARELHGDGASLKITGPALKQAPREPTPVTLIGTLAFAPDCLCYTLIAAEVAPWNSPRGSPGA